MPATNGSVSASANEPVMDVENLDFSLNGISILSDITLQLPAGARCLLIGANGAGKSTLLRVLAGKRMVTKGKVNVLGYRAFFDNIPVSFVKGHLSMKSTIMGRLWKLKEIKEAKWGARDEGTFKEPLISCPSIPTSGKTILFTFTPFHSASQNLTFALSPIHNSRTSRIWERNGP